MNRRVVTILLIAFLIAAGCTWLVALMIRSRVTGAKQQATTRLLAAKVDIKLGSVLDAASLTTIDVAGVPPKGAFVEKDSKNVIGRGVISDLYAGEPILDSRLAAVGSGGGLAATIPQGMRATAVKVDDVVNVSGFVTPGMRVDVLITGQPPNQKPGDQDVVSRTILQDIQVLSAGTDIQKDNEGKPKQVQVVNLLVTPEQAETLSLATGNIKIQLVLRNPLDTKVAPVSGTNTTNLFADTIAAPKARRVVAVKSAPKAPDTISIQVLNGSKQSEEKFASPGGKK